MVWIPVLFLQGTHLLTELHFSWLSFYLQNKDRGSGHLKRSHLTQQSMMILFLKIFLFMTILVASGDVFVEDFQPRERSGMWPSMVTSSLLLLILSPFPSVHTTWPPFLLDAVYPPAREQVQKTSVFLELSCFCVLPAEIPSGANVPGQLLLWKPSFPFVRSALSLRGGLDRIVPWGQTWYIPPPQGRSLLESKCPGYLSPGTWSWAQHWLPARRTQPALTALTSEWRHCNKTVRKCFV